MLRKAPLVFSLLLLLFCISFKSIAQPVLDVSKTAPLDLNQNRFYYEDKTGELTFEEIQSSRIDKEFKLSTKKILNYGFTSSAIWLKIKLKNSNLKQNDYLALVNYAILDEVDFYFSQSDKSTFSIYKSGDMQPFTERIINNRKFLLPLQFTDTTTRILYLRVANKTSLQVPFEVITKSDYQVKMATDELGYGLFYGVLLIMIFYNFFVFLSLKDLNYLYYIITILGSLILLFSLSGHQSQYLFPQNPLFANQFVTCGSALILIGLPIFTIYFNDVKKYSLIFYGLLWSFFGIGMIVLFLTFLKPSWYGKLGFFTNILGLFVAVGIISSSIYCFNKGQKSARFFIVAFSLYIIGILSLALKNLGVFPVNFLTTNAGEIGASLEVLFLSFALSDRYNLYKKQQETTQKEMITMEKQAKETLEQKVARRTSQLQEVNQELNKQQSSIISSINYAKTIQTAMLPFEARITEAIANFFIFYKPRDIVSGDFYFFANTNSHVIFAALDCTGHGVPGAFMSMIGHEILGEIVNVKNIYSPDLILEELHKGIRSALQQDQTENRDGMDAVIVSMKKNELDNTDTKFEYLEYAGAMNPFYYVQKSLDLTTNQQVICEVIKGTKHAIGGRVKGDTVRKFEKHRVELVGYKTKFWLCTDGYQDQFGGKEGRKFLVKNFRKLLFSLQDTSLKEQKKIIGNVFEEWTFEYKQVDDVLVIGVEI